MLEGFDPTKSIPQAGADSTGLGQPASFPATGSQSPDKVAPKESRQLPRGKVTTPHSVNHDIYIVCRQGVIAIEKWRSGMQEFQRAIIYPNQSAVYVPAGWFYTLVNPSATEIAEIELYHFPN
ncbi:hypothetical protein [Kamptonema formosum]|uniref:hypothetical protein n=1 Tax=Kamptonema formosum TaxID=331992 RepID=UPI0003476814|nr:hypothetical protein [Oscillatoria sp. PCC 10802]